MRGFSLRWLFLALFALALACSSNFALAQTSPPWLCISLTGSFVGCPNATPTPTPTPAPTPTPTPTPTPVPSTVPATIVQTFTAHTATSASASAAPAATPAVGDVEIVAVSTYNAGGTNIAVTAPSGWTGHDTCWDGNRNGIYTFYHYVTGTETLPYVFAYASGTSYLSIIGYDLSGTATVNPFDQSACSNIAAVSTVNTATLTPVQTNELAIAFSTNGYQTTVTDSAGWLSPLTANGGIYAHAASQFPSVVPTFDTLVFGGTVTSGETLLALINPAPAATVAVIPMTQIYTYAQSTTACGGGYNAFDSTAAQDVFWGIEYCMGDSELASMDAKCPANSNCRTYMYTSTTVLDCGSGYQTAMYNSLFNAPGTNDAAFLHSASPPSSTNRNFATTGHCDTSGGSTGTHDYFPNVATTSVQQYIINTFFAPGTTSWINGSTWKSMFFDNQGMVPMTLGYGAGANIEYPNVQSWLVNAIAPQLNAMAPYSVVLNSEGPGSGSYPHNNGTGNAAGILNWAIDDADLCNNLTSPSDIRGFLFEKLIGNTTTVGGVASDYVYPSNVKTGVNTASVHFNNTKCKNIPLLISGMTGQSGTTSWPQRAFGVVLRGLMSPTGYNGAASTAGIVMGPRFTANISSTDRQAVFPEDELVMTLPYTALTKWCWGGNASCNGNGQSNADAFGGGCYGASGDTGGINTEAQLCGSVGTGPDGGTGAVYVRDFQSCYRLGSSYGPCAVVFNASTTTNVTLSQLTLHNAYTFELTPSGGELYDDPVHMGHPICSATSLCTGAWAETSVNSATTIPHCTYAATGSNNAAINVMIAQGCFVVLLSR